mmetsp:Transcript_89983/g.237416  ORF Transcript_89983/g.237416 Transcript_89983/m.237416 type:complete len:117 (-) Transcript_89983:421-771(-)
MTGPGDSDMLELYHIVAAILCGFIVMISQFFPFAAVAEVYEYDLLRTLNKPQVLHKVMKHLGQQMLPHLHTLDWGFKIGQTMINMKLVINLIMGMSLALITTVGSALMSTIDLRSD